VLSPPVTTTTTQISHSSSGVTSTTLMTPSAAFNVIPKSLAKFPKIPRYRPVRITIPALNINSYVGTLGLQHDNHVQVPTSTHIVDWYKDGALPGQVGSAVILGHVDSYVGPGTFFNLKNLKTGDVIKVQLADKTIEHFVVTEVVQYAKTTFPDHLVYGSNGTRSLHLVTCGGTFDHATGHYESNVVVYSQLASVKIPEK
jgi:sortase (surface protein transpeptidase)